jgi:hypothetical protein
MAKNYLLIYSEQLATDIELLCQNIKAPSDTLFQIRKSSSSVYANIVILLFNQDLTKTAIGGFCVLYPNEQIVLLKIW